jgi:hypothetical protein
MTNCCRTLNGFVTLISDSYGWYGIDGNYTATVGDPYCSIDITVTSGGSISDACFTTLKDYLCNLYNTVLTEELKDEATAFMNQCLSTTVTLSNGETISTPCNQVQYYDSTCDCFKDNPNYDMWRNKQGILAEQEFQNITICFADTGGSECVIR